MGLIDNRFEDNVVTTTVDCGDQLGAALHRSGR